MAETKIEWTSTIGKGGKLFQGYTFNPWRGCTKISPECAHCYAETFAKRNAKLLGVWGSMGTRVVAAESYWNAPLKWNAYARKIGVRLKVFCASMADVFEDWSGAMFGIHGNQLWYDEKNWWNDKGPGRVLDMGRVRERLFKLIDETQYLDWLLLTKRIENVERMVPPVPAQLMLCVELAWYRKNLWLGTTIGNQEQLIKRVPELEKCSDMAAATFVSAEPLLGPLEFSNVANRIDCLQKLGMPAMDGISWVIVGGESGHGCRPMDVAWARSIRDQCKAAEVPFFMKQMGGVRKPYPAIPDDLMIREYPNLESIWS